MPRLLTALLLFFLVPACAPAQPHALAFGDRFSAGDSLSTRASRNYRINGRSVSLACEGAGRVPVIFLAGGTDRGPVWSAVRSALPATVLTCTFNRPGVLPGDAPAAPLTPQIVADTLNQTLSNAGLGGEYVLVAHSLGALTALRFGATYPDRLMGAVFLDPTVPAFIDDTPADRAEFVACGMDPEVSKQQASAVTRWPFAVPVTVLSHDPEKAIATGVETTDTQRRWSEGQISYARLVPNGTQENVANATHYVQRDNPEKVADAIQALLHRLPSCVHGG